MGARVRWVLVSVLIAALVSEAGAGGRKRATTGEEVEPPAGGKRVIELAAVPRVSIELPDGSLHDFGPDLEASLSGRLTLGGRFTVMDRKGLGASAVSAPAPGFVWKGSRTPSARLRFEIDALTFRTGNKGSRVFYGFDERTRSDFNDGTIRNEFPLRELDFEPNWFGRTFDRKGSAPFDSQAGLDLGEGLKLDFLFAWLQLKYVRYRSELRLRLRIEAPLAGRNEERHIEVRGDGYHYDIAGGYQGYSGAIGIARRDAMTRAFRAAIEASMNSLESGLGVLPAVARLDHVLNKDGVEYLLLGTGPSSDIPAGTLLRSIDDSNVILEVQLSNESGSVATLRQGSIQVLKPGALFVEGAPKLGIASRVPELVAADSLSLPETKLPKADFQGKKVPKVSWLKALFKSIVELVSLPYRLWRYGQYDQVYQAMERESESEGLGRVGGVTAAAPESPEPGAEAEGPAEPVDKRLLAWSKELAREPWAKRIGLQANAKAEDARQPIVAVIDSGVDYNHSLIRDSVWKNQSPWATSDGTSDRYGWDFVSGDSRPYDDSYHGTQVAGLILGLEPKARIMALKAFDPWGVTSSAALYGAFRYAVDHGARIIVCAWATPVESRALEQAVAYAAKHDVLVIAAAGDTGTDLDQAPAYPASLVRAYSNVLAVAAVDENDAPLALREKRSSFGAGTVELAAPGLKLRVLEPRGRKSRDSSSGLSAALAAGAAARILAEERAEPSAFQLKEKVLSQAERVSSLEPLVHGGLRLKL